jgi:hypothetical protein
MDQSRQQADQHRSRLRFREFLGDHGNGRGRSHFAQIQSTHAVRHGKQIAMRSSLLARGRNECAHRVFIIRPDFARIAGLAELYL